MGTDVSPGSPDADGYWWESSSNGCVPSSALIAGNDRGEEMYIGRVYHESGALVPGKVHGSHGCCYIPWEGKELSYRQYEVLCTNYKLHGKWEKCQGNEIPSSAIKAGLSENGEPLYIGRHRIDGCLVPGKVQLSHARLYIAYAMREHAYFDYEVLVSEDSLSSDSDSPDTPDERPPSR